MLQGTLGGVTKMGYLLHHQPSIQDILQTEFGQFIQKHPQDIVGLSR